MIQPLLLYQSHQDFTVESCLFLGAIVLVTGLILRKKWIRDLRETYPAYHEIPSTILTHMSTRKELQDLDKTVDVVVSCVPMAHLLYWYSTNQSRLTIRSFFTKNRSSVVDLVD
jgi:hypothetical protein